MRVFVVQHEHEVAGEEGRYEVKFIGVYSTEARAEAAVERAKSLPGFRDYPDCFSVTRYEVDTDHWTSGFVAISLDDDGLPE